MPIYAYKCESCGHAKDVLQKMADAPLTDCPVCGKPSFKKQLTAAGFQLKGNGWYATDFKGGPGGAAAPAVPASSDGGAAAPSSPAASPSSAPASSPAADSSSASAASSTACAASCACH
jgi:putative FmdB family regulatory protein